MHTAPGVQPLMIGKNAFSGMQGFPEGLAQYIATTATVVVTDLVMQTEGLRFSLIGQGDNILQGVEYPVHEMENGVPTEAETARIGAWNTRILDSLAYNFSEFELTLSRKETWSHNRVSVYGKDLQVDGRLLPFSIKKIAKISTLSNDAFPTLDKMLSSISSAATATTAYSPSPAPA